MTKVFNYKNIKEEYGINVLELVRRYERLSKTKGRYQSHLRFYLQCKHEELTPKGIKIRSQMQNADARKKNYSQSRKSPTKYKDPRRKLVCEGGKGSYCHKKNKALFKRR